MYSFFLNSYILGLTYCIENEEKKKEVTTGRFNENMLILAVS
jgi:hypothetical protein